jgi:hypothetical protein
MLRCRSRHQCKNHKQLKAVDFEDDIILQWKPRHWFNLAKDTASACRPGVGIYTIPPSTQWTAWTYLQKWATEEIHPHPPTTGFITVFIVSHSCPVVTLVHFHMYERLGTCHYWIMNAVQHPIWDIGIPLVGKRLFIATFAWTQKGNCSHSWC